MESLNECIIPVNVHKGSGETIIQMQTTNNMINDQNNEKAENKTQLCRLCANNTNKAIYIFSAAGREQHLADKINQCLPVSVKVTDLLPKQLCTFCNNKLNICYNFAERCIKAEEKLKQMMKLDLLNAAVHSSSMTCNYRSNKSDLKEYNQFDCINTDKNSRKENYMCPLCSEGHMNVQSASTILDSDHNLKVYSYLPNVQDNNEMSKMDDSSSELGFENEINTHNNSVSLNEKCSIKNNNVFCHFCAHYCPDWNSLLMHTNYHRNDYNYSCILCDSVFTSEIEVENHLKIVHFDIPNLDDSHNLQGNNRIFKCSECTRIFVSAEKLNFHLQLHSVAKYLICTQCSEEFLNADLLFNHMIMVHGGTVSCNKCTTLFTSQNELKGHQCHVSKLPFRCKICGKEFHDSVLLRKHKTTHSLILAKPFECNHCNASFSRISKLNTHVQELHGKPNVPQICYKCCTCYAVFSSLEFATLHCGKHTSEDDREVKQVEEIEVNMLYCCEYCDASFTTIDQSKQHRSEHVGANQYGCTFCNLMFYEHNQMKCHKKYHLELQGQGDELSSFSIPTCFPCEWCEKTFATWKGVHIHYNSMHSNLTNTEPSSKMTSHLCEDCGESFNRRSELRWHKMKLHKPQNRFPCEVCGKVLLHYSGLVIHRRQHTGERPFMCDVCGKSFPQGPAMYTHRRTHTRDYPYCCEICSQKFNNKGDLNNHRRSKHTKERPFKCNVCQKSFLTSGVFYQHKQLHAGIRKYKCDKCDRAFSRWNALSIHIKSHTGEKPHHCLICGRGFAQKGDMKKHMRSQHKSNLTD